MRTDRELLWLAAKAAGFVRMWYRDGTPYVSQNMHSDDFVAWNPLTDDGDALRLAVKLRLDINEIQQDRIYIRASSYYYGTFAQEPEGIDNYAATRRAIVRAAAEIGAAL